MKRYEDEIFQGNQIAEVICEEPLLSLVLTDLETLASFQAGCLERFRCMFTPEQVQFLSEMDEALAEDESVSPKLAVAST